MLLLLFLLTFPLRELLLVHLELVDPIPLPGQNRADTLRVVIVIISPMAPPTQKTMLLLSVPLPLTHDISSSYFMPRRRARRFFDQLPQHLHIALDGVVFREDTFERAYFVNMVCEGRLVSVGCGDCVLCTMELRVCPILTQDLYFRLCLRDPAPAVLSPRLAETESDRWGSSVHIGPSLLGSGLLGY